MKLQLLGSTVHINDMVIKIEFLMMTLEGFDQNPTASRINRFKSNYERSPFEIYEIRIKDGHITFFCDEYGSIPFNLSYFRSSLATLVPLASRPEMPLKGG